MRAIQGLLILMVTGAGAAEAQSGAAAPSRHPLEGVWSRVAGVTNGDVVTNQPGYRMFVDGHWSTVRVEGLAPRVAAPATGATAAQVRAAFAFTGQAGSYAVTSAQTYLQRPVATFNPAAMAPGAYGIQLYRVVADTLWTSNVLNQAGPIPNPQTGKYVRVRNGARTLLDGAWRLVEGRAPDGTVRENQPGIRLFADGHYSTVRVNGTAPRPALPGAGGTAEQLMAVWGPFTSQVGTFEVSGGAVTERVLVAKGPAVVAPGNFAVRSYRIAGDTLWMTQTASQSGPVTNATTFRYMRVRAPRPPTD